MLAARSGSVAARRKRVALVACVCKGVPNVRELHECDE
jgi:hypothetical protein